MSNNYYNLQHYFIRIDLGITGQDVVAESGGEGTYYVQLPVAVKLIFQYLQ